jgi:hypothetical protein
MENFKVLLLLGAQNKEGQEIPIYISPLGRQIRHENHNRARSLCHRYHCLGSASFHRIGDSTSHHRISWGYNRGNNNHEWNRNHLLFQLLPSSLFRPKPVSGGNHPSGRLLAVRGFGMTNSMPSRARSRGAALMAGTRVPYCRGKPRRRYRLRPRWSGPC